MHDHHIEWPIIAARTLDHSLELGTLIIRRRRAGLDVLRDVMSSEALPPTQQLSADLIVGALVTGRAQFEALIEGTPKTLRLCYLNVWTMRADGWKFTGWQSCPLPA